METPHVGFEGIKRVRPRGTSLKGGQASGGGKIPK